MAPYSTYLKTFKAIEQSVIKTPSLQSHLDAARKHLEQSRRPRPLAIQAVKDAQRAILKLIEQAETDLPVQFFGDPARPPFALIRPLEILVADCSNLFAFNNAIAPPGPVTLVSQFLVTPFQEQLYRIGGIEEDLSSPGPKVLERFNGLERNAKSRDWFIVGGNIQTRSLFSLNAFT